MVDVLERVEAEEENIKIALENLNLVMQREDFSVIELAAAATFLTNVYMGMENILKQVLKEHDVRIAETPAWHKELLAKAASLGIITKETSDEAGEYLVFRHRFIHGYGFLLEEEPIRRLGEKIPALWSDFITEVKNHIKKDHAGKQSKLREKASRYSAKRKKRK